MSTKANLYIDKNTDFFATLELLNEDISPYNLTDELFYCDFRKNSEEEILFSANVSIYTENANNEISLEISRNDTLAVKPGKYQYDILMEKDNKIVKIINGFAFLEETLSSIP